MLRMMVVTLVVVVLAGLRIPAVQAEDKQVLFLSKSQAFEHGPVARAEGRPSLCDVVLGKLVQEIGGTFHSTKDASLINAEELDKYDLVVLYTQGDLTQPSVDGAAPMGANGVAELIEWVENGGGLVGFHAAADTFRVGEAPHAFITLLGAEFLTHGAQFKGTIQVVDPKHPTMANVPDGWTLNEEWYLFRRFDKDTMHVLALLEPGAERAKQEAYNIPAYPIIWCSKQGKGRVYYSALGHREDVWTNPQFQQTVIDAMEWAMGKGRTRAQPNFDKVVPTAKPEEEAAAGSRAK